MEFCQFVDEFNASFAIPATLTTLGMDNRDIEVLVQSALRDTGVGGNPVEMTEGTP